MEYYIIKLGLMLTVASLFTMRLFRIESDICIIDA